MRGHGGASVPSLERFHSKAAAVERVRYVGTSPGDRTAPVSQGAAGVGDLLRLSSLWLCCRWSWL